MTVFQVFTSQFLNSPSLYKEGKPKCPYSLLGWRPWVCCARTHTAPTCLGTTFRVRWRDPERVCVCEEGRWRGNKSSRSTAVPGRAPCQERLRQQPRPGWWFPAANTAGDAPCCPLLWGQGVKVALGWDEGCWCQDGDVDVGMLMWERSCRDVALPVPFPRRVSRVTRSTAMRE